MDFDNPKVYGDTFISDGLVIIGLALIFVVNAIFSHIMDILVLQ